MSDPRARIRVLLVDDHAVVRAGYRVLLSHSPEIDIIADAGTGEEACRLYADLDPDVVVMDLSLPGIGGLGAIRRIMARDPSARVLVFSMHEDPMFVDRALANGASGYVTKRSAPTELVEAVRHVAAGRTHLDPSLAGRRRAGARGDADTGLGVLSTREFEIFCLLAEGLSAAQIAGRMRLSPKTVANYSTQVRTKLEVGSLAELARLAIRHGIIEA